MHYDKGFYFCTESNHDGKFYESRHLVSIPRYYRDEEIHNRTDNDFLATANTKMVYCHDYRELTVETTVFLESELVQNRKFVAQCAVDHNLYESRIKDMNELQIDEFYENEARRMSMKKSPALKPHVLAWLNENAKPSTDKARADMPAGWAYGSDGYRATDGGSMGVWFLRRADAMRFIKTFSQHKNPLTTYNQDTYKRCILTNGKLIEVKRRE